MRFSSWGLHFPHSDLKVAWGKWSPPALNRNRSGFDYRGYRKRSGTENEARTCMFALKICVHKRFFHPQPSCLPRPRSSGLYPCPVPSPLLHPRCAMRFELRTVHISKSVYAVNKQGGAGIEEGHTVRRLATYKGERPH